MAEGLLVCMRPGFHPQHPVSGCSGAHLGHPRLCLNKSKDGPDK